MSCLRNNSSWCRHSRGNWGQSPGSLPWCLAVRMHVDAAQPTSDIDLGHLEGYMWLLEYDAANNVRVRCIDREGRVRTFLPRAAN